MTDAHVADEHHGPDVRIYLVIFGALSVVTAITFSANFAARQGWIPEFASFLIILGIAIFKATLVAVYFMHLLFDWKRVYMMIVPALILGPMLVIVLLPDIVLAWK